MRHPVRRRLYAVVLAAAVAASASGCHTPTHAQWREYEDLKESKVELYEPYEPGVAAALNVLPGVGNAYNGDWGLFVVNLLLWPYSVAWGVPEAYISARNKNVIEALDDRKYPGQRHRKDDGGRRYSNRH